MTRESNREKIGLPPRPFLYTIDQLAVMLDVPDHEIHTRYIYHQGRDVGIKKPDVMGAVNIAQPKQKPEWRVTEREFLRWMKFKGFKYYERAIV